MSGLYQSGRVPQILKRSDGFSERKLQTNPENARKADAGCLGAYGVRGGATWRDLKNSISQIAQKQKITSGDGEDKDVIAVKMDGSDAVAQVFFIRQGRLIGRDHFFLRIAPHDSQNIVISSFMKQFYSGTPFIPREIMIPCEIEDQSVLEEWLGKRKGQKVHIKVPKKRYQGKIG